MSKISSSVRIITALLALLFTGLQILRIIWANDGLFIYTLDDAYIHLDLAQQLGLTGVYGVNTGVSSSPASSILWPFLLAPFAALSWLTYVPLALNLIAVAVAGFILPELISRCSLRHLPAVMLSLLSFSFVLILNLPALALMGMEHAPHVACALFIALGLLRTLQGEPPPYWLWLAILISPLLRYEGAIISGAALLILAWRGNWRPVLVTGTLITLALAAFSLFLLSLGLDALPASTIVKKAGHLGGLQAYFQYWQLLLRAPFLLHNTLGIACILGVLIIAISLLVLWPRLIAEQRLLLATLWLMLCGQMVLGRYSNIEIYRYEYYLLALALPLLAYTARPWLASGKYALISGLALILVLSPMLASCLWGVVRSSHVIYLQHYALQQLVHTTWQAPVAVNDIGMVGYRNPNFVLDLWGLADSEVLHARRSGEPGWLKRLMSKHNVRLVMINDSWWQESDRAELVKVGELRRLVHSALASDSVSFYTPDVSQLPEIKEKLTPWVQNLPNGAEFTFTTSTASPP